MDVPGAGRWVTDDNYSSVPSILSWFVGIAVFLCVVAKLGTKVFMKTRLSLDDVTISIAMTLSIGMVATISVASANGLGRWAKDLTLVQINRFQKSIYATDILFVFTMFFSKISMLAIVRFLTPVKSQLNLLSGLMCFLVAWTLAMGFAAAFQCPTPDTWTILSDKCFDQTTFWTVYNVINIVTELSIALVATLTMKDIQISKRKKSGLAAIFGLRIFVIAATIIDIIYRQRVVQTFNDATMTLWPVQVCRQFVQGLSIIFACIPYMKPFFSSVLYVTPRLNDSLHRDSLSSYRPLLVDQSKQGHRSIQSTIGNWTRLGIGHNSGVSNAPSEHSNMIQTTRSFEVRSETRNFD